MRFRLSCLCICSHDDMDVSTCTGFFVSLFSSLTLLCTYLRFITRPRSLLHLLCYDLCLFWDYIVKEDFGEKELILRTQGLRIYFKLVLVLVPVFLLCCCLRYHIHTICTLPDAYQAFRVSDRPFNCRVALE